MKLQGPLFASLALLAAGCAQRTSHSAQDREATQLEVEQAVDGFAQAQRALNVEEAISYLATDFYMYLDGQRLSRATVVRQIEQGLASITELHSEFTAVEVIVFSSEAAVSSFVFRDSVVSSTGDVSVQTGPTTLAWTKREGRWLLVYADADHYPDDFR